MPEIVQFMDDTIGEAFKGMNSAFLQVERTGHLDVPDAPAPAVEPNDMTIVISPCHPYEFVKVPADHTGPLHCLVCGSAFAV